MKIGLFFGSFNPVHSGHLVIASYMAEFTDLEQVWLVVSPHNPLKKKDTLLKDYHRLQLVRRGIEANRKLKASNIELKMEQPSYTIHTLAHLHEKHPQHTFVLILGSDNLKTLHRWKNFEQIISDYELYVYPRLEEKDGRPDINSFTKKLETENHHVKGIRMVNAPIMEISAQFIRKAIQQKKDVRYMMPDAVYNYILEMHFYEK